MVSREPASESGRQPAAVFATEPDALWGEALAFSAALRETPGDAALRRAWQDWLARGPAQRAAWARAERAPGEAAVRGTDAARRPARRGRRALLAGGGLAAAVAVAGLAVPGLRRGWNADYRTGAGELRQLTLEDGTRVELDTATALSVAYTPGRRALRLLCGQAFFAVVHDPARPFTVQADRVSVSVLGTRFNLRRTGEWVALAVEQGEVSAALPPGREAPAAELLLGAGESLSADLTQQVVQRGRLDPGQALAWRRRHLLAEARPVAELLEEIGRYYPGLVWLADAGLGERRVTGLYDLTDVPQAVRRVVAPLGGRVRQVSPYLLWVGAA
ncbi:FecR family protein [Pseudoroseomonas cervicalis]|uniref:FecR family protein n=1 Tax=Teichococcus cervicalis TaxID=204525 RepID=UPI0022F1A870|nr:FecR domain-containing protein [Pseudoroseomonas cervicalis]WBV45154.1 FecR domain-containing protein [Pseudoroseomonas cervicalis]